MKWLWIAAVVILIAAAGATWFAFQRPDFVAGLTAIAVAAAWKAFKSMKLPSAKRHFENVWKDLTPESREKLRQEWRARERRAREQRGDR